MHQKFDHDTPLLKKATLSLIKVNHLADLFIKVFNSLLHDLIVPKLHHDHGELRLANHWVTVTGESGSLLNSLLQLVTHLVDHDFGEFLEEKHVLDQAQLDGFFDCSDYL